MKMGEIRFDQGGFDQGGFEMMTPAGLQRVTLRCRVDGVVMVEEVAGGGLSIKPMTITSPSPAAIQTTRQEVEIHRAHGDQIRAHEALRRLDEGQRG